MYQSRSFKTFGDGLTNNQIAADLSLTEMHDAQDCIELRKNGIFTVKANIITRMLSYFPQVLHYVSGVCLNFFGFCLFLRIFAKIAGKCLTVPEFRIYSGKFSF